MRNGKDGLQNFGSGFVPRGRARFRSSRDLLGAHFGAHNAVHIVSGHRSLLWLRRNVVSRKDLSLVFGVVYLALGVLGFALGTGRRTMWHVGPLEFGQADHGIHVLLGIIFLAGGLFTKRT